MGEDGKMMVWSKVEFLSKSRFIPNLGIGSTYYDTMHNAVPNVTHIMSTVRSVWLNSEQLSDIILYGKY